MTRKIWFIRHAESITNAGGTWSDHASNPLTSIGHKQASLVSEALSEKPSLIVTSPFVRTLQTAQPTLDRWPDVRHEEWPVYEFATFCYKKHGEVTSALWAEHAKILQEKNDPDYRDGEHAETVNELMSRIDLTIQKLQSLEDKKVLVFSHGFFLGALFYRLANLDAASHSIQDFRDYKDRHGIKLSNTSVSSFSLMEDGSSIYHSTSVDHLSDDEQKITGY